MELTCRDVAEALRGSGQALGSVVAALPPALAAWHPAPGQWCAREVAGHLIEAERRGFAGRIRIMLAEPTPRLSRWDPEAVARERRDCGRDSAALLTELAELRAASAALVAGLSPSDLERDAEHPVVGHLRVVDLLHEWLHHDANHLRQILANVQAFVWPAMGNTQRFSPELLAPPTPRG